MRKAFLNGLVDNGDVDSEKRYHRVDTLVHEFSKLFGKSGVPEYCVGVISFPDFLEARVFPPQVSNKPTIIVVQRYNFTDELEVDTLCLLQMVVKSYTSEMQPFNI